MSKLARQWYRAVKRWGVGDETKCTRREFKRWRILEHENSKIPWITTPRPCLSAEMIQDAADDYIKYVLKECGRCGDRLDESGRCASCAADRADEYRLPNDCRTFQCT